MSLGRQRMEQTQTILPILVREAKLNRPRLVIVVDLAVENGCVYWRRVGYVFSSMSPREDEVYWMKEINWQFDRTEYSQAVNLFWEQQTLWEVRNIPKGAVIDAKKCLKLLADLTIGGSTVLEKHKEQYGEIQLSILAEQLVLEPLMVLLKRDSKRGITLDIYRMAVRVMYLNGSLEVSDIVKSKFIPRLKSDELVWNNFSRYFHWMEREEKSKRLFWRKLCVVFLIFVVICCYAWRKLPVGRTDFKSFEHFVEMGGETEQCELPEYATDVKYYLSDPVLYRHSIYAFTIEDDEQYESFIQDEFGGFIEPRSYAKDYKGEEGSYERFPMLPYEKVIEDDIMEYTMLSYSPATSVSAPKGVFVNEETHRFVVLCVRLIKN